jgi:hypothetical protein
VSEHRNEEAKNSYPSWKLLTEVQQTFKAEQMKYNSSHNPTFLSRILSELGGQQNKS